MATVALTQANGYEQSRYEKQQVSYGVIKSTKYSVNDVINFVDLPAKTIIKGEFIAPNGNTLRVFSDTDLSEYLPLNIGSSSPVDVHFVIEFIKGSPLSWGTTPEAGASLKVKLSNTNS